MAKDWSKIYKENKGKWVALRKDEVTVISSAKTLKEAQKLASKKGYKNPIFARMPQKLVPYVGFGMH